MRLTSAVTAAGMSGKKHLKQHRAILNLSRRRTGRVTARNAASPPRWTSSACLVTPLMLAACITAAAAGRAVAASVL